MVRCSAQLTDLNTQTSLHGKVGRFGKIEKNNLHRYQAVVTFHRYVGGLDNVKSVQGDQMNSRVSGLFLTFIAVAMTAAPAEAFGRRARRKACRPCHSYVRQVYTCPCQHPTGALTYTPARSQSANLQSGRATSTALDYHCCKITCHCWDGSFHRVAGYGNSQVNAMYDMNNAVDYACYNRGGVLSTDSASGACSYGGCPD
jgi:hypothetical protein